ncbi:hypothetical protein [Paenibacillus sp. NRS-1760]|uniref:hypothetical protein n=1 Tax=Paenibacillus sp. NRS-1760 TaxID=3233902 RepID=UPI003D2B89E4
MHRYDSCAKQQSFVNIMGNENDCFSRFERDLSLMRVQLRYAASFHRKVEMEAGKNVRLILLPEQLIIGRNRHLLRLLNELSVFFLAAFYQR